MMDSHVNQISGKKFTVTDAATYNFCKLGLSQSQIAKKLGISRQAVSKRFRRLEEFGIMKKDCKSSIGVYHILPDAEQKVNHFLAMNEKTLKAGQYIISIGNFRVKYPILKDNSTFKPERRGQLRNWGESSGYGQCYRAVSYQKTPSHVVFTLQEPVSFIASSSRELDTGKIVTFEIIRQNAQRFAQDYGIKLDFDNPEVIHREIKIFNSRIRGIVEGKTIHSERFKCVYPKRGCVEFYDELAAKNFIDGLAVENNAKVIISKIDSLSRRIGQLESWLGNLHVKRIRGVVQADEFIIATATPECQSETNSGAK